MQARLRTKGGSARERSGKDPNQRARRCAGGDGFDRLVREREAALRPVEVEVALPAAPLAVEAEVSAERGVLGRETALEVRVCDGIALLGESHHYADFLFASGIDPRAAVSPALVSTVKSRRLGFADCMDSEEMLRHWLGLLVERGILPG